MTTQQTGIIAIVKSAITGEKYFLPDDFDIIEAAKNAKKHQISAIFYYGAVNCGISIDLPIMQKLFFETCSLMAMNERQMYEIGNIFQAFDENRIDYMPLKGTLLKKLYPKAEMRIMSDSDILIKTGQYDRIKPLMIELGFTEIIESDHELIWEKDSINIELHKRLIPSYNKDYYEYFGDGWRLGVPVSEGATRYKMSAEDEMIYLFTHFAKHYRDAGIGIKHLVDLWIYRKNNNNLNEAYIIAELKKLKLDVFYKNILHTIGTWFDEDVSDDISELITNLIFNSGVYGTYEARILSAAVKTSKNTGNAQKTRLKKIFELIFLPYRHMRKKYPILTKAPFLLPFMWVVRWFEAILFKRDNIQKRNNDLKIMSVEEVDNYQNALNFVGLDFNFKE